MILISCELMIWELSSDVISNNKMSLLKIVIELDFGIWFSSEFKFKDFINSQIQWWQIIKSFVNNLWNLFIGYHMQCHKITQKWLWRIKRSRKEKIRIINSQPSLNYFTSPFSISIPRIHLSRPTPTYFTTPKIFNPPFFRGGEAMSDTG